MVKKNTLDLTLWWVVKDAEIQRIRISLANAKKVFTDVQFCCVDYNSTNKDFSKDLKNLFGNGYHFCTSKNENWNRSDALNHAIKNTKTLYFMSMDSDFIPLESLAQAVQNIVDSKKVGVFSVVEALPIDEKSDMTDIAQWQILNHRGYWGEGCLLSPVALLKRIGGYDSRLQVWGGEDNDISDRLRTLVPIETHPSHMLHWSHNTPVDTQDKAWYHKVNNTLVQGDAFMVYKNHITGIYGDTPVVSACLISSKRKNCFEYIIQAVESLNTQTFPVQELVFVTNGHSFPKDFIQKVKDLFKGSVIHRHLKQASIPLARNTAYDLATGEWLLVVDDDDINLPNRVYDSLQVWSKNPQAQLIHGGCVRYHTETQNVHFCYVREVNEEIMLFNKGFITHPTVMVHRCIPKMVRFNENMVSGSDADFMMQVLSLQYHSKSTESYVLIQRFHGHNITMSDTDRQQTNGKTVRQKVRMMYSEIKLQHMEKQSENKPYYPDKTAVIDVLSQLDDYSFVVYVKVDKIVDYCMHLAMKQGMFFALFDFDWMSVQTDKDLQLYLYISGNKQQIKQIFEKVPEDLKNKIFVKSFFEFNKMIQSANEAQYLKTYPAHTENVFINMHEVVAYLTKMLINISPDTLSKLKSNLSLHKGINASTGNVEYFVQHTQQELEWYYAGKT